MKVLNPEHIRKLMIFSNSSPYAALLGMKVVEVDLGSCKVEMEVKEKHLNPYGGIHGGVYESLLDTATFWAIYGQLDEGDGLTTVDLKADLLSTVSEGTLTVEARAIKVGRTICMAEGTIKDQNAKLLTHGTSKLMVIKNREIDMGKKLEALGIKELPPKFLEV